MVFSRQEFYELKEYNDEEVITSFRVAIAINSTIENIDGRVFKAVDEIKDKLNKRTKPFLYKVKFNDSVGTRGGIIIPFATFREIMNKSTESEMEPLKMEWAKIHLPDIYEKRMAEKKEFDSKKRIAKKDVPQYVDKEIAITSLQIAERTGKEHKNVMRDIRDMLKELNGDGLKSEPISESPINTDSDSVPEKFIGTYKDGRNREKPMYILPEREALILATGYSATLRAKIIDELSELKKQVKPVELPDFSNPAEAARAFAAEYEKKVKAISESKHKSEIIAIKNEQLVSASEMSISADESTIAEFAKMIAIPNFGPKRCFKWLRDKKYLMKNNEPYQKYVNEGLFKLKPQNDDKERKAKFRPILTPRGRLIFSTEISRELVKPKLPDFEESKGE